MSIKIFDLLLFCAFMIYEIIQMRFINMVMTNCLDSICTFLLTYLTIKQLTIKSSSTSALEDQNRNKTDNAMTSR